MLAVMKILSLRLSDDVAEYVARTAAASRLSFNQTVSAILTAARDNGWTEVGMVPVIRRASDDLPE